MRPGLFTLAVLVGAGAGAVQAQALTPTQAQGISSTEIVLGTIQDLSGPFAAFGKQARNGMQLRVDELNAQGGIAGRRLVLLVEDAGFDPRRAALAAHKLVHQDKIFLMAGHMGAAPNQAAMPVQFERNVINFLPISASRAMHEPFHRLKYALAASDFDQMRQAAPRLARDKGIKKPCAIHQDDPFGLAVLQGAEAGLRTVGLELAETTRYKRGATDFSVPVARLKAAGCDMVILGTIVRETIGAIGQARKTGFNPVFLGSSASYTDLVHKLGGKAMDGLYATMTAQHPYLDDASQPVRFWANKYKAKFSEDPTVFSVYGYTIINLFAKAAQQAGADLRTDTFIQAMDALTVPPDMFGSPQASFTATKHQGSTQARLSQLVDGRWKVVGDDTRLPAARSP